MTWSIDDLVDNYRDPAATGEIVFRVGDPGQRWPLFHASDADPDGGYRAYRHTIVFDCADPADRLLRIEYLAIAPRVAYLELELNGVTGCAYPRPEPSRSDEIRLQAGLHTTLYCEGELRVVLPAALLRRGENRLVLVARDDGEVLRVENPEAVKRLDRMASAAGLVYQRIALEAADGAAERVELRPSVVYRRGGDGVLRELCELHVELAAPVERTELALRAGDERIELALPATPFGHVRVPFELRDGEPEVDYLLEGVRFAHRGVLRRRRKWRVHVTPHAHTDIGYTRRQSEVAERLARNVDVALERGAAYHLDSAWALEAWRATRTPERMGELAVSGIYVDVLTQYAALEDLVRNALAAERLLRPLGLATDFAAIVDVASLSGSLPTLLEGAGLRYLVHASNQDRGPFRVNSGLHRRSPYWWEGPGGGRVLVWLAKMYCELRKVCGSPPTPSAAARGLDLWLREYERDDYATDVVLLYGQEADNTDLDPQPADFVRRWNETYEWPRLVPSDVSSFFREVEPLGDRLPTLRGDGGAYWEDGCGSTTALTAAARGAQADLPAAERLDALAALHQPARRYPEEHYDEAWRQLLLWEEHTWGAFLSAREPEALLQRDVWATKEQFGLAAVESARRLVHAAATRHSLEWGNDGREVVVYNPHSWEASGGAVVEIEPDEAAVDAETGDPVPARQLRALATQQTVELWVDRLPGLAYRRFPLRRVGSRAARAAGDALESEHYRVELDPERGCVRSLHDRALGRELVDADAPWGFGQLVHALGGEDTRLVGSSADLPEAELSIHGFRLRELRRERFDHGSAMTLAGDGVEVEWTLHDRAKRLDVAFTWRKEERLAKEAAYVAFPADLPGATRVLFDSQLGWVTWGEDELPGACQEWLPLQTSVLVRGDRCDLLLCSPTCRSSASATSSAAAGRSERSSEAAASSRTSSTTTGTRTTARRRAASSASAID